MLVKKYINGRPVPTTPNKTSTPVKKTSAPKPSNPPTATPAVAPTVQPSTPQKKGCGCGKK